MIPTWGVSNGTLCEFSTRCFKALETALHDQVAWPGQSECESIVKEFASLGFSNCVGLIDGFLLSLSQHLKEDGELLQPEAHVLYQHPSHL